MMKPLANTIYPAIVIVLILILGTGSADYHALRSSRADEEKNAFSNSAIIQVNETHREGYLMVLLPSSRSIDKERVMYEFRIYVQVSAFLALKHLQQRSGEVLPFLPDRLNECNIDFKYKFHDTMFSPLDAGRHVYRETIYGMPRYTKTRRLNNADHSRDTNDWWGCAAYTNDMDSTFTENEAILAIVPENLNSSPASSSPNSSSTTSENEATEESPSTPEPESPRRVTHRQTSAPRTPYDPPRHPEPALGSDTIRGRGSKSLLQQDSTPETIRPFAVMGAARSAVSHVISTLGNPFQLPQISPISTSTALDNDPFFARTIPTSDGEAMAIIAYLSSLGVTKCAILYLKDEWGSYYRSNVEAAARPYNIDVKSIPYTESDIELAVRLLKATELRYIVGIISPSNWKPVVRMAYDFQMIGNPNYQWFFGSIGALTAESFTLDGKSERDVATAIHGAAIVSSTPVINPYQTAHDQAMQEFANNSELQREFVCHHQAEPDIFRNVRFHPPGRALFHYLTYDGIIALALTACDTPGQFTGQDFYDNLLQVDFEGVSGQVRLHNRTGTRLRETLRYRIANILINFASLELMENTEDTLPMVSTTAILVDVPPEGSFEEALVEVRLPWIYNNNGTTPPVALPSLEEEMNMISDAILIVGYVLAAATMLLSAGWACWVLVNHEHYVVRASQPVFLVQLCTGTFIMGSAVIPMSFQEPMPGREVACMSIPWLLCCGFTTAFSALFGKTLRVNKLMNSGTAFRRVQIQPRDVIQTFVILMVLNVTVLTVWTLHSTGNGLKGRTTINLAGR